MKPIPFTTIAAVLLAGCGEPQQQTDSGPAEVTLSQPGAENAKPEPPAIPATAAETPPPQPVAKAPAPQPPPEEATPAEPPAKKAEPESLTAKPAKPAPNLTLREATMSGDVEMIKHQLAGGADVSARDVNQWTPLYYAKNQAIAELLITNGADVNARDREGHTPLHTAAMSGWDTVELLIANGADVNAKVVSGSYKGMTPLDLTSKAEIAELIRKLGGRKGE
ncbi:MAG: ankyrin repeat domain-containing protein [Verrucomicrobiota bacterium]|nr:ankyrin repeat domain-containing protein [Verrucomicrobiota bacterium]